MPLELTPDPAHLADAPPLMACTDCGCLIVLEYVRVHTAVCPGGIGPTFVRGQQ